MGSEIIAWTNLGKFPTAISKINYPIHKGQPNPAHGKFYFVGSVPGACYDADNQRSFLYDTEQAAIDAAILAGAVRIQRYDNSFVGLRIVVTETDGRKVAIDCRLSDKQDVLSMAGDLDLFQVQVPSWVENKRLLWEVMLLRLESAAN